MKRERSIRGIEGGGSEPMVSKDILSEIEVEWGEGSMEIISRSGYALNRPLDGQLR